MKPTRNLFVRLLSLSAVTLLGSHSAQAASATWNGTTSNVWSLAGNWSTSPVPGTGDTATFNNAGGTSDIITVGTITISQILFDTANAAAYTLGASPGTGQITLNDSGSIVINSAVVNNQVINSNVVLGTTTATSSYSFTNNSATPGQLLTIAGSVSSNQANAVRSKTLTLGGSANGLVSGIISGDGSGGGSNKTATVSLLKSGTGTWTLSNANTYSGTTTISAGTLVVGAAAPSGSAGALGNTTSAVILGDATTLVTDGPSLLINGVFTVARAITVGSLANTAAYNATIGGSNTTGTSTFSGNITLNNTATNYTTTLRAATGGTVDFITGTWATNNRAITIGSSGNTGTVKLSNTLATTGGISVNFGTFLLGASDRLGDTTPVTVAGGILDTGTALTDTVSVFNMSSGSLNGTGTITAATYGLSGGTVTGNLGAGTMNVTTGTTVNLNGTSAATAVNVNSGTLLLGANDRLANGATVLVAGGILDTGTALTDTVSVFNMSSGSLNGTGTITAATYGLSGGTVNANLGTGTLTVTGAVGLSGTSAASTVNVNSGSLTLGSADRLANAAAVAVSGGALAIAGFNDSVGAVSLTGGSITGSGGTLTGSSYAVQAGSISAKLGGAGIALTKTTVGTVSLSGANTYSGATTIQAGTLELLVGGSLASTSIIVGDTGSTTAVLDAIASALIVANGQTVSGIGTIKGSTTIQLGGTIAPGNSAGILTNLGNISLQAGSNFQMEINGATAGSGYDQLNVTGGSSIVTLAGLLNVTTGFTPTNGSLFFLIDNDGPNAISGTFSNAPVNGNTYTFGSQQYAVSYLGNYTGNVLTDSFTGGNDVVLMAVPEPGAALLGGLGVLLLLRRRREPTV